MRLLNALCRLIHKQRYRNLHKYCKDTEIWSTTLESDHADKKGRQMTRIEFMSTSVE
jgi:hypothetical protein